MIKAQMSKTNQRVGKKDSLLRFTKIVHSRVQNCVEAHPFGANNTNSQAEDCC